MKTNNLLKELQALQQHLKSKIPEYTTQVLNTYVIDDPNTLLLFQGTDAMLHYLQRFSASKIIPESFQQLFSQSFLRLDPSVARKHKQLDQAVQLINDLITTHFQDQQEWIQRIIKIQKDIQINGDVPEQLDTDNTVNELPQHPPDQVDTTQVEQPINNSIPAPDCGILNTQVEINVKPPKQKRVDDNIEPARCVSNVSIESIKAKYRYVRKGGDEVKCEFCFCDNQKPKEPLFTVECRMCCMNYHMTCLGLNTKETHKNHVCPRCVIQNIDPMSRPIHTLAAVTPFHPVKINHKSFTFMSPKVPIEVRCIRIDNKHGDEENTWPDVGELIFNGKRALEFKPLQVNSSLKKRKDDKAIFMDPPQQISMTIKESMPHNVSRADYRIILGQLYFLGIFNVERMGHDDFVQRVQLDPDNWLSVEQSQDFIALYLSQSTSEDVEIASLTVSLQCQLDWNLMGTPARGNLCEHVQCFSLQNVCQMMEKMIPRRWRCPVCKSKIYKLQIDAYQLAIINTIRQHKLDVNEVTFDLRGGIMSNSLNSLFSVESLPQFGKSNSNRIIQLEQFSSKYIHVGKHQPTKTQSKSKITEDKVTNKLISTMNRVSMGVNSQKPIMIE